MIKSEAEQVLAECGVKITFDETRATLNGEKLIEKWKTCWDMLRKCKARYIGTRKRNVANGLSVIYNPNMAAAVINMQKQMIETRKWKASKG